MNRTPYILIALLLACGARAQGGYALPVVQVQRWTPLKLGPDMWLDASDAATVTLSGTNVTAWADKSGKGNNAAQVGADATRPSYLTAQQNGLNTIYFDGGDYLGTSFLSATQTTVIVVARVVGGEIIAGGRDSIDTRSFFGGWPDASEFRAGVGSDSVIISTNAWGTAYRCAGMVYDGTTVALRADGKEIYTKAQTGTGANFTRSYYIGGLNNAGAFLAPFSGYVGEALCWRRKLTGPELAALESYLETKWIPWTPLKLGAKLAIWYDGNDAATLLDAGGNVATNGAYVQTWNDKSGNGRHATAPASAQRPRWFSGIQNGRAVVRTDGGDQLDIGSAGGVFRNKTAGYIFAVAKDANQAGGDLTHVVVFFSSGIGTSRFGCNSRDSPVNEWAIGGRRLDGDSYGTANGGGASGMRSVLAMADWGAGFRRISVDGAALVSSAYSSGAGATSDSDGLSAMLFRIPASKGLPSNSEIAEVVVVNAAMTDAEIAALQNYLKAKWGTP